MKGKKRARDAHTDVSKRESNLIKAEQQSKKKTQQDSLAKDEPEHGEVFKFARFFRDIFPSFFSGYTRIQPNFLRILFP